MTASLETFRTDLDKLLDKIEADKFHYISKDYLEAQSRVDFVTPFFETVGWNVGNKAGLRHGEREV